MVQVMLVSRWGSLFAGEIGTYPDDVAATLVAEKRGKIVLENGELQPWSDEGENAVDPRFANLEVTETPAFVFDATVDPFMLDGLDEVTSLALHTGGLHTPGDVEKYINDGKVLTELAKVTAARAKKIAELYGVK